MRWHIIGAFIGMNKIGRIFRDHTVHMAFKIYSYRWIRIFINGQTGRRMLDKNVQHALAKGFNFWNRMQHCVSDQMKTPGVRLEPNFILVELHCDEINTNFTAIRNEPITLQLKFLYGSIGH